MSVQEIANRLQELCDKGDSNTAYQELFSPDATSTEPNMVKGGEKETMTGMPAIRAKEKQFNEMVEEMHGGYTKPPVVFGNHIFIEMGMEATLKGMGRISMNEMAHYVVDNGKIISQEFFY